LAARWTSSEQWRDTDDSEVTSFRCVFPFLNCFCAPLPSILFVTLSPYSRIPLFAQQGHVDTVAKILSITPDGDSIRLLFSLPLEFYTPLIPKGYISLDGTSLTLTHLSTPREGDEHFDPSDPERGVFGVMLVKHTQSRTVVAMKEVGETVNVECDVVGKGVESVVRNVLEGGGEKGGALEAMIERAVERVLVKKGLVKE
jgi:riboflavin synthase